MSAQFPATWQGQWYTLHIPATMFAPSQDANMSPNPAIPWTYSSPAPYNVLSGLQFSQPAAVGAQASMADLCINTGEHFPLPPLGAILGAVYGTLLWTCDTDASAADVNMYMELWSVQPSGDLRTQLFGSALNSFRASPGPAPYIEVSPPPVLFGVNGVTQGDPLFIRIGRRLVDPGGNDTFAGEAQVLGVNLMYQIR